jgi:hypothetical protein
MDLDRTAIQTPWTAGNKTVSLTPTPLVAENYCIPAYRYILIHASALNDESIYIAPVGATEGYELPPSESVKVPVDAASKVCVFSLVNDTDTFSWASF